DVEQDDIRFFGGDLGERFLAVGGGSHGITLDREQIGEQLHVVRRVVDDQHLCRRAHWCTPTLAASLVNSAAALSPEGAQFAPWGSTAALTPCAPMQRAPRPGIP